MMTTKDRFRRGNSTGVSPNYESEGSGGSAPVDTELTALEDSSVPMRNCINLASGQHDGFNIPLHVLPVSKMPFFERKDLLLRLRAELKQIRMLQMKAEEQRTDVVALSSSGDIVSSNAKIPLVENLKNPSRVAAGSGTKEKPPGHKGHSWNCGTSGRFLSSSKVSAPCSSNATLIRLCEALLEKLMQHQYGWVFNSPVDVVKLKIPDYFNVIKHPMDLGTIKSKIASSGYQSPLDFVADVRLTFSNAMTYNPQGNDVHFMADTLSRFFEVRWKAIEKKLQKNSHQIQERSGIHEAKETIKRMPSLKRRKITSMQHQGMRESIKPIMTDKEKHKLSRELEALMTELPENIVQFLREQISDGREIGEDEIEIDINDLTNDTLLSLRKLLDEYLQEKQKNQAKGEPCEILLQSESVLNSSTT